MTTQTKQGSAPVCWDCKERIPAGTPWRRFEPTVILPPSGVVVCGPTCTKAPANSSAWTLKNLPDDMRTPPTLGPLQHSLALW